MVIIGCFSYVYVCYGMGYSDLLRRNLTRDSTNNLSVPVHYGT
jgi:hypothetical protein